MTDTAPMPPPPAYAYRPALDGVRALAVTAVLLFHGGVGVLRGGFLGVDAFFVLSGFLITSLLLAERARNGRIRLSAFWVRRARRLLPALLVLLVVVVAAFRSVLAGTEVTLLRGDALAALGYIANWRMIYRGSDYFAQNASPSPLQHTWSLGIEEQFYLLWPLLVVAGLALTARRGRAALLTITLVGATASMVTAALLYRPLDSNRAYFGTDARAQALLIGAALAVLLSWPERTVSPSRGSGRLLGAVALIATAGVGWLWASADGQAAWLYRGGLAAGAVAVAVVLAHVVLSPQAPIARLLALAPLVWLGRISYGVYLWHWPLFQYVNAERTGLHGPALLGLRFALTLAVAAVSYVLVEQPVRTGRLPRWPVRAGWTWPAWLPRLGAAARARARVTAVHAGLGATAIVGATAAFIIAATIPSTGSTAGAQPRIALPSTQAAPLAPVLRPNRRPGLQPRITFLGDSVSWSLGTYLPPQPGLAITVRAIQGCGIARLPDIVQLGEGHTNYPACPTWDSRWRRVVAADDPDVAVILLDRWELMDRRLNGVYQHVGQPEFDAYLAWELDLAISVAGEHGAHVVLLTAPYTHRAERPDGGLYDEDQPARVEAWNGLLRAAAARAPDRIRVLDLNAVVCPDGEFTWTIDGLRVRSDGLHFTQSGVQRIIAPWLLPQLAAIALGG
ncbi:MAG: acyltransferase family protein [Micromonosporaceae bacterium]